MKAYRGKVKITDRAGVEHEVEAALTRRVKRIRAGEQVLEGLGDWVGTLSGDVDWWALAEHGEPVEIRLPTGRAGQVLVDFSTSRDVSVKGSGDCPFAD